MSDLFIKCRIYLKMKSFPFSYTVEYIATSVSPPMANVNGSSIDEECALPLQWIALSGIFLLLTIISTTANLVMGCLVCCRKGRKRAMSRQELAPGIYNACTIASIQYTIANYCCTFNSLYNIYVY